MAGKKGRKKRFWSDDEKRSICAQTQACAVSIAQVARRYSMNANLIHKWQKDPRFTPSLDDGDATTPETCVLPIEIVGSQSSPVAPATHTSSSVIDTSLLAHRADITLSDGRRILVEGSTALPAVLGLIKDLMS